MLSLLLQQIANGLRDGVHYLLIALVLSPVAVALLGIAIGRMLFRRFYRVDPILSLLLTVGPAMLAEQTLRMIFGAPPLSFSIPVWLRGQVLLGDVIYPRHRAAQLRVAIPCVAALWLLLHRTPFGRVVRAGVQNPDMVGARGISPSPSMTALAAIATGLARLAGVLLLFNNRRTSGEVISVQFSDALLAMVVIGGMRSSLGPALGALFFVIFRDSLSRLAEDWLFWLGLRFVAFIVFSPTGLVGVAERLSRPWRKVTIGEPAIAARRAGDVALPDFLKPAAHANPTVLEAHGRAKHFGGIRAVQGIDLASADRTLHASIGPNGAGKTAAFNVLSGMFPPDGGTVRLLGEPVAGPPAKAMTRRGIGRSVPITTLFPALTVEENVRLAVQARSAHTFEPWRPAQALAQANAETAEILCVMGLAGVERAAAGALSYGGQRLLDMALATRPRVLLLGEPFAGLAPLVVEELFEAFDRLCQEISIIIVDHPLDLALALSDRTVMLARGEITHVGPSEALSREAERDRRRAALRAHKAGPARPEI